MLPPFSLVLRETLEVGGLMELHSRHVHLLLVCLGYHNGLQLQVALLRNVLIRGRCLEDLAVRAVERKACGLGVQKRWIVLR